MGLKIQSCFCSPFLEKNEIQELYNLILKNPSHQNISFISTTLSYAAAGKIEDLPFKINSINVGAKAEKIKLKK